MLWLPLIKGKNQKKNSFHNSFFFTMKADAGHYVTEKIKKAHFKNTDIFQSNQVVSWVVIFGHKIYLLVQSIKI